MRSADDIFPEIPALRALKIFQEVGDAYGLFDWYTKRTSGLYTYKDSRFGGVDGLRAITDEAVSSDMAKYGAPCRPWQIRSWRNKLAEKGLVAYSPRLNGIITVTIEIDREGIPDAGPLPEFLSEIIDAAVNKNTNSILGLLMHDIAKLCISATAADHENSFSSVDIVRALNEMQDRPWQAFNSGRPITPAVLARMLRIIGIGPRSIRSGKMVFKGYKKKDFMDVVHLP